MRKGMFKFLLVLGGVLLCSSFTTDKSYYPNAVNEPECMLGFVCNIEEHTGIHICVLPELDNGTDCSGGGTGGGETGGGQGKECRHPIPCIVGLVCIVNDEGQEMCIEPFLYASQMENQTAWGKVKSWLSNLL